MSTRQPGLRLAWSSQRAMKPSVKSSHGMPATISAAAPGSSSPSRWPRQSQPVASHEEVALGAVLGHDARVHVEPDRLREALRAERVPALVARERRGRRGALVLEAARPVVRLGQADVVEDRADVQQLPVERDPVLVGDQARPGERPRAVVEEERRRDVAGEVGGGARRRRSRARSGRSWPHHAAGRR